MSLTSYRGFQLLSQIEEIQNILIERGIECAITEEPTSDKLLFPKNKFKPKYILKIKQDDFSAVDDILLKLSSENLNTVENDHYLFSFSDNELNDVISNKNEWCELDFLLAKKILSTRKDFPADDKREDTKNIKIINQITLTDSVRTRTILLSVTGLLIVFIVWHFTNVINTILASVIIGLFSYLIRRSYIDRLKHLTCPNCGQFDNSILLSREERSKELVPVDLKNKITVTYRYQCASCKHKWYTTEYEDDPLMSN